MLRKQTSQRGGAPKCSLHALLAFLFVASTHVGYTDTREHQVPDGFVNESTCDNLAPGGSEVVDGTPHSGTSLRFKAAARQVLVPVVVTDGDGRPVKDLRYEDFRLYEDSVEQSLDSLMNEETPLTLALVLDVSGSMRSKMERALNAITKLVIALRAGDRIFVIGFNDGVEVIQELTCHPALAIRSLEQFEPTGGTAMFDGVVEGLYRLYKIGPSTRRALVLLSDGFDNASINTPRETVAAAKAVGVPIYAVGLGEKRRGLLSKLFSNRVDDEFNVLDEIRLRALAENTGGRTFVLSDIEHYQKASSDPVASAFESLAREVRTHYLLSFQPASMELDGQWHELSVDVARPDVLVRFRPGYLALPLE